ncbi:LLM class flavin-dependent oxidoreductase [Ilumatobacter sp.]|uniref:LLM class flavin-dependent oxidoreductase n=1 Tax=Ilumatobacter sp. TaxID=1967498 RepID=UPI003B52667C
MELFANLTSERYAPDTFARSAESAGFDGVTCSDHFWLRDLYPHVWVSLAAMATATERVALAPSFVNNLFRSPFEFAQASVSMQRLAGGRYEAGLGAGWTESEMIATGREYPDGPTRARMYREALLIVKELLTTGRCDFQGDHYRMEVPELTGFTANPIPLVASVGGDWTVRNITPIVDRVELKVIGRATRGGSLDMGVMAGVTEDELLAMIEKVRDVRDDIPIGLFTLIGVGASPPIDALAETLGDGFCGRFVGEPAKVLDNLRALEEVGISRVQVTELVPGSIEELGGEIS